MAGAAAVGAAWRSGVLAGRGGAGRRSVVLGVARRGEGPTASPGCLCDALHDLIIDLDLQSPFRHRQSICFTHLHIVHIRK